MLLTTETREIATSALMATAKATIKATPKVFSFFSDMTYANKPKAICRELVANAVDAHVMAGTPELPVEVWIPNLYDPTFRVRDSGIGMAHEFMMTNYMAYTDGSTKSGSNIQIGGFGIGSKSPFAYTDQYNLRVVHENVLSVYSVFKDEDGIPSIALLGQTPTTDANGVEVSFPVAEADFVTFSQAAREALAYFDPLPVVHNLEGGELECPSYATNGSNWGMREQAGPLNVIMGGVCYPVDTPVVSAKVGYDSVVRSLLGYGLDVVLPIGSCSIALSREALSYDDDTIKAVVDAVEAVAAEVAASMSTIFDHHPNAWEAAAALATQLVSGARSKFLQDSAMYKGQKLEEDFMVPLGTKFVVWEIETAKKWGSRYTSVSRARFEPRRRITPAKVETIIIDDLPRVSASRYLTRVQTFAETAPREKSILVFRSTGDEHNATEMAEILEFLGKPPVTLLSTIIPTPRVRIKTDRPKVRMWKKTSAWGTYNAYIPTWKYGDTGEVAYDDQPSTGVLVVAENFIYDPKVNEAIKSGLLTTEELYFVNKSDAVKLKGWTDWKELRDQRLAERLAGHENLPVKKYVDQNLKNYPVGVIFAQYPQIRIPTSRRSTPVGKLKMISDQYWSTISDEDRKMFSYVEAKAPTRLDIPKIASKFAEEQPMLAALVAKRTVFSDEIFVSLFEKVL